jgi:dolichol-phosphate mannosyltransferase
MIHVLLAAYNEESALGDVLESLICSLPGFPLRVWVVDDGSTDRTAQVAESWGKKCSLELVRHSINRGLGAALKTGFSALAPYLSDKDVVVTLDADNTHSPAQIPEMVRLIENNQADLVVASRFIQGAQVTGVPAYRRFLSECATFVFRMLIPVRGLKDYTCGFRCYTGSLVKRMMEKWPLLVTETGFAASAELVVKAGSFQPRVVEVPLILRYDKKPTASKMRVGSTIVRNLVVALRLRKQVTHGDSVGFPPLLSWFCGAGILAVALYFRLRALDWGVPLKYAHIDESVVIHYSLRIVAGVLNPDFYDYPGFFLYLLAGTIRLVSTLSGLLGGVGLDGLAKMYVEGDGTPFTLMARGLSVGFALLTVWLTYDVGRRRAGQAVGLFSAAWLAVNVLHVQQSHYATVDVTACFFTLLAIDRILEFQGSGSVRQAVVAAFCVGLGAATKYYPGVLLAPLLAIPVFMKNPKAVRLIGVIIVGTVVGFFVGSPFTFLAGGEFLSRFNHLAPKIVGVPGTRTPFFPTIGHLWDNVGLLGFVLGGMGVVMAVREGGAWRWMAVLWASLFCFVGLWRLQSPHYALGLYPPLFLLAARGTVVVFSRRPWVAAGLGLVVLLTSLAPTLREIRYLEKRDTRLQMADWVRSHIPPGSRFLRFSHTPNFSPWDPFEVKVDFTDQRLVQIDKGAPASVDLLNELSSYDYLLVSSASPDSDLKFNLFREHFQLIQEFSEPRPRGVHNPAVAIFSGRVKK